MICTCLIVNHQHCHGRHFVDFDPQSDRLMSLRVSEMCVNYIAMSSMVDVLKKGCLCRNIALKVYIHHVECTH